MDISTLSLVSWGGNNINDTSNYEAGIPIEVSPLAEADIIDVQRSDQPPAYATKTLSGKYWTFKIEVKSGGSLSNLMKWFNPYDTSKYQLIVKDTSNGNKQWYVYGVTKAVPVQKVKYVVVQIYVDDPVWRSVTEVSTVWSITASGQTKVLTNSGNTDAYLKLDVKPTSAKAGWNYRHRFPVRAYHVNTAPLPNRAVMIPMDTAALVNDTTKSNQINVVGGITAVATSFAIDTPVGGGLETTGGMLWVDSEQIKYSSIAGNVVTVASGGRGWAGTTAAIHADNAVCKQSHCRADGNDVRVFWAGTELDRWLNDMNTSGTEVWTEGLNVPEDVTLTLSGSISGAGSVTTVNVKDTEANKTALEKLPATGGLIEIVTGGTPEVFVFTARDTSALTITTQTRNARGTTAAAHSDGDTIRWRALDLWVYCGFTDASAPEVDTTKKPACDLSSSNSSLTFSEFGNLAGTRPFSWRVARLKTQTKKSRYYTGNHDTIVDPITDLGCKLSSKKINNVWMPEDGIVVGRFYDPGGLTSESGSGEKYRVSSDWPQVAEIQKSTDGLNWETVLAISTPTAAAAWQAWTLGVTALGATYKHTQIILDGTLRGRVAQNAAYVEADTMTIVLASPMLVTLGPREDMYNLDGDFKVQETGEILGLAWPLAVNETLYMDSAARTITHQDGTNAYRAKSMNTRRIQWLRIPPGSVTLLFTETNATNLTVTVHYEERNL